jgi:hypothetical protein
MITDSFDGLSDRAYDVCVVGGGPVGIALALRLAALGKSVVMLESGGERADPATQALADADIVYPDRHDSMMIATARRLGGTSNLWGGRCLPFDPIDFENRPAITDAKWPISYGEIEPYYQAACETTDSGAAVFVSPPADAAAADEAFSMDRLERWSNSPKLQRFHHDALLKSSAIDIRLFCVVTDLYFNEAGVLEAVRVVRPNGESEVRLQVGTVVLAAGGVEVTRLLLAAQRQAPLRFGGVDGPLGRYYMGHLTGVIADIRMANLAMDAAFDFYVDAFGGYVRRRFVPSDTLQRELNVMNSSLWPVVPAIADATHGSGTLSALYLALAWGPLGRKIIAEAILKRHIPDPPPPAAPHIGNVVRNLPSTIPWLADFLRRRYAAKARIPGFYLRNPKKLYGLCFHSEQWPNPESRITLTDEVDRLGLPKARISYTYHERDVTSVIDTHEALGRWLQRSDLGELIHHHPPEARPAAILAQAKHGAHQIGTTRMGFDRSTAVVDKDLRTFDCPNLFVASCSTLPTSGQANPTLTAVALALRLADRLANTPAS